jgi:thiamine-monophosphate kinase
MSEKDIIKRVAPLLSQKKSVKTGPGDDCAVIDSGGEKYFLIAADQVVSDIHYERKSTPPELIAAKLLKRNLSDIAAMGGIPDLAVMTVASAVSDPAWHERFFRSLNSEAEKHGVSVCGGDFSSMPSDSCDVFSLTITGHAEKNKLCLRANARRGQFIYVTGEFGCSFRSGHHLSFAPRLEEAAFLAGAYTSAMIDVSDGLLKDLGRVAEASGAGAALVTEDIPLRAGADLAAALSDGEDYELLFTVDPERAESLERNWPFKTALTKIGYITSGADGMIIGASDSSDLSKKYKTGYEHYA